MRAMAWAAVWLVFWADGAAHAQGADPSLQARVGRAVARDLGLSAEEQATGLRLQVPASGLQLPEAAALRVAAVHAGGWQNTWLLRLECSSRLDCLPFEVIAQAVQPGPFARSASGSPRSALAAGMPVAPLVRAGQRVLLAEESRGMRLSAPAVCLQAGSLGQRIRVRNVASGRVVRARVRAPGKVTVEE